MRKIIAQLDMIAAELETMGQTPLAYGVDQISDKLEKEAFLKELGQGLKDQVLKMMPKEKALEMLAKLPGLKEKLPGMIAEVLKKLNAEGLNPAEGGLAKEAGLHDFLGKPILLALAVVMLSTGFVHANDADNITKEIAKTHQVQGTGAVADSMAKVLHAPGTTGLNRFVPLSMFESKFEGAVEDNLKNNAQLKTLIEQQKAGGASNADIANMLREAFNKKMQQSPADADSVKSYLGHKDVSDTGDYLNKLVYNATTKLLSSGAVKTA